MYQKKYNKEIEILELYTRGFNKEYYVREIAKLLKISPRTAQLTLENMEKKTILNSSGLLVISSVSDDKIGWLKTGKLYSFLTLAFLFNLLLC